MTSIATSQNSQQQHAQKKPERGGEAHWLGLSEGLGGIIKHLPRSVEVSPEPEHFYSRGTMDTQLKGHAQLATLPR